MGAAQCLRQPNKENMRICGTDPGLDPGLTGVKLTRKQADYLGVSVDGPYKPEHYRY